MRQGGWVMGLLAGLLLLTQCKQTEAVKPVNVPSESARAVAACLGRIEPRSRIRKVAPPDFLTNPRLEALSVGIGDQVQQGQLLGWFEIGRAHV